MSKCQGCQSKDCKSRSVCKPNQSMKEFKKGIKIKKMLMETQKHNRRTCTCKACWHYSMGFTLMKNLRFYFVVPNWKSLSRDEYLRGHQRITNYRLDKKTTKRKLKKFLKSKSAPPNMIPKIIEQMQSSMFVVMYKASPMGMLREI